MHLLQMFYIQMITMKLEGMDETMRALNRLDDNMAGRHLETAAKAGILPIQNQAKENAPWKSGTLRRSIHEETVSRSRRKVEVATGTDVIYARIHELGGVIVPKTAAALAFEIDGQLIITQRVEMPARPYMRPAFDEKKGKAEDEVRDSLRTVVRRKVLGPTWQRTSPPSWAQTQHWLPW